MLENLTYGQAWRLKKKAKEMGMSVEDYISSGKFFVPKSIRSESSPVPSVKELDLRITKLSDLEVNDRMFQVNETGLPIDQMFSYESGIPAATNIMITGDPGVGKTTVSLHALANLQLKNPHLKCLFVSFEMGPLQVYKYTKRFPVFKNLETIFGSECIDYNVKDVLEQVFSQSFDYILIDSIAEVISKVREDNAWSQQQAEKWLVDLCVKHNKSDYTTFLLIQQVTKNGVFVGSNKVKHLADAHLEMKRRSDREGGGTYMMFSKNRNGSSGIAYDYTLMTDHIQYGRVVDETIPSGPLELVSNIE